MQESKRAMGTNNVVRLNFLNYDYKQLKNGNILCNLIKMRKDLVDSYKVQCQTTDKLYFLLGADWGFGGVISIGFYKKNILFFYSRYLVQPAIY